MASSRVIRRAVSSDCSAGFAGVIWTLGFGETGMAVLPGVPGVLYCADAAPARATTAIAAKKCRILMASLLWILVNGGEAQHVPYFNFLKNRPSRGTYQWARSSEKATARALPTIRLRSISPMKRLSLLLSRLSPIT